VFVPLVLAAWDVWRRRRAPVLALAVVPVGLWWLYLRRHLGAFPFGQTQGSARLGWPLLGWVHGILDAASQSWNSGVNTAQLGQAAVPLIVVTAFAVLITAARALRLRSPLDPVYLVLAAIYACIVSDGVLFVLLPFVLATRATPPEGGSARTRPRGRPIAAPRQGS
jgi:hypothetical protein